MKKIGYFIISVSFLAGALVTVLETRTVQWSYFLPTAVLGVFGIILVRTSEKRHTTAEGKLASNMQNLEESLDSIVGNMQKLNEEKVSVDVYEIRHHIDAMLPDDLNMFVEARESISHVYSLQAYANVMSDFAAGERYLNRVWSASADGYVDEVSTYLEKAQAQFVEAREKLLQLKQKAQ